MSLYLPLMKVPNILMGSAKQLSLELTLSTQKIQTSLRDSLVEYMTTDSDGQKSQVRMHTVCTQSCALNV